MIKIDGNYSYYFIGDDPHYPGGKAKPTSGTNRIDGTAWKDLLFNQIIGFFQACIIRAYGQFLISSVPDTADNSDVLNAILQIMVDVINEELTLDRQQIKDLQNAILLRLTDAPKDGRSYNRRNGAWFEAIGGGGDAGIAIKALKFWSDQTLMLTNADTVKRRLRGFDIGQVFISASSKIYHFDTDENDQNQESNIMISYSGDAPVLVGREDVLGQITLTPAVYDDAPFESDGKSLFGQFSLSGAIASTNLLTVEFWARLPEVHDVAVFALSSAGDSLSFSIGGSDPELCVATNNDPELSAPDEDGVALSAAGISGNTVTHSWQGGSETINLIDYGIVLEENTWIHIGAIVKQNKISFYINNAVIDFTRQSTAIQPFSFEINEEEDLFNLDELLVDGTTVLEPDAFIANSESRIPYAALGKDDKWTVIEVDDPDKLKTNLFESESFKSAVLSIVNN
jgi:hypothetical protein